jgi:hypothetical protein
VVSTAMVIVEADGHEIGQLSSIPQVEHFGVSTDEIATDEHIQHSTDE